MKNQSEKTVGSNAIEDFILNYLRAIGSCDVEYLISAIKKQRSDLQLSDRDIADTLNKLDEKKKVSLSPPSFPSFFKFVLSPVWSLDFCLMIVMIATSILSVYFIPAEQPFVYLRAGLGLLFLLYLPGYPLVELLFPSGKQVDQIEKTALRVGLSISTLLVVGLFLNFTPFGLTLKSIVPAIGAFTLTMTALAWYRRYYLLFSRKR